ncbi:hypothetical protein [Streptacidiphilus jiangxiensis]|uniref:hypothetical protein n=1 Tax=Streptacidiphilus jiangxiensis TaxID=235985 RepID=UPI0005A8A476|nr:hypothetical protein [Streptacidiphilus jiangxiensis]
MTVDAALPAAPARPRTLTAGAWFSVAQGVVIAAYGVYVMVAPLTSSTRTGVGMAEFAGVILLLMGLLPLAAGRALLQVKKWGRSPAVMVDTLCLAVAYFAFQNGGAFIALGVAVGLAGIAGVVLLLHPRTTAALWPSGQ